jgi:hypothetical protein
MAALADEQRLERFFRLWTLKEVYAKARLLGALLPFDRLAFSLRQDEIVLHAEDTAEPASWHFRQLVAPMHVLAVAVRAGASAACWATARRSSCRKKARWRYGFGPIRVSRFSHELRANAAGTLAVHGTVPPRFRR